MGDRAETALSQKGTRLFGDELLSLLRDHDDFVTLGGRPNLRAFSQRLSGVSYESLRRAVRGKGSPSVSLIEEVSRVLQLRPEYFLEYRLAEALSRLDPRQRSLPDVVRAIERLRSVDRPQPAPGNDRPEYEDREGIPPMPDRIAEEVLAFLDAAIFDRDAA